MKKMVAFLLTLVICIGVFPVFANEEIKVYLDNEKIQFDVSPLLINGRTMVPMRTIFEKLGAVVYWDNNTRTAISQKGNVNVSISIDEATLYKNGEPIMLDVPAQLNAGRTLVPLRAVSEAFECDVQWNGATHAVNISSKKEMSKRETSISTLISWFENNYNNSFIGEENYIRYEKKYDESGLCEFTVRPVANSNNIKITYFNVSDKENIYFDLSLIDLKYTSVCFIGAEQTVLNGYIGGSIYSDSLDLIETSYESGYTGNKDIILSKIEVGARITLKMFDDFLKSNNIDLTLKDFDLDYDLSSVNLPKDSQQKITFETLRDLIIAHKKSKNSDKAEMVKVYEKSNGSTQYSILYDDKKDVIRLTNTRIYMGSYSSSSIDLTSDNQVYDCSFYFTKSKGGTPDFEATYIIDAKTFGENSNINFENIKGNKVNMASYKDIAKLMNLDMLDHLDWVFSLAEFAEFSTSDFGFNIK